MKKKISTYTALVLWILIIFVLSSIPAKNLAEYPFLAFTFNWDKVIHFGLYFVLGILTYRVVLIESYIKNKSPWIAILFCVCYGILDELHQLVVPGRSTQLADLLADSLGAIVGVFLWRWLYNRTTTS